MADVTSDKSLPRWSIDRKAEDRLHEDIQPTRQCDNPIPLPIWPVPRILGITPRTPNQVIALFILMREVDMFLLQRMEEVGIGVLKLYVGFACFGLRIERGLYYGPGGCDG
mgnify:CR=1 FL=1